ncbi:MAG: AzlD family protein [Beijerinckiaceae bacterium]
MSGLELTSYTAIIAMACVTLFLRMTGYWIVGRVPLTPRFQRALEALPLALFAATIVPLAIKGGPAGWIATPVVAAAMFLTRNELLALALGVAAATLMRSAGL